MARSRRIQPTAARRMLLDHDVAGYYNRFDVFDLTVDRSRLHPVKWKGCRETDTRETQGAAEPAFDALNANRKEQVPE